MKPYPKIHTIWKRDQNGKIIENEYSKEEFKNIRDWLATEKIDGMNMQVSFVQYHEIKTAWVEINGRTEKAEIPTKLYSFIEENLSLEKLKVMFPNVKEMHLFGEGFGAKIQKGGGLYTSENKFILFDVWIDGFWLDRDKVQEIGKMINIPVVPSYGIISLEKAIEIVKLKRNSVIAENAITIEGLVLRSYPLMLFRDGTPIMTKIKVKDY